MPTNQRDRYASLWLPTVSCQPHNGQSVTCPIKCMPAQIPLPAPYHCPPPPRRRVCGTVSPPAIEPTPSTPTQWTENTPSASWFPPHKAHMYVPYKSYRFKKIFNSRHKVLLSAKKNAKIFWRHAVRKNGFRKKNHKNKNIFCPCPPFCKNARIAGGLVGWLVCWLLFGWWAVWLLVGWLAGWLVGLVACLLVSGLLIACLVSYLVGFRSLASCSWVPTACCPLFHVSCPILHLALLSENDESGPGYQGIRGGAYLCYRPQSQSPIHICMPM